MRKSIRDQLLDFALGAMFVGILGVLSLGTSFIGTQVLTPRLLEAANCAPRVGMGKVIEAAVLFGGMAVGMAAAFGVIVFIGRNFIGISTHDRWDRQLEERGAESPWLGQVASAYIGKLMRPRQSVQRSNQSLKRDAP